jgi:ribA/ribD-fused uncharacterized protein
LQRPGILSKLNKEKSVDNDRQTILKIMSQTSSQTSLQTSPPMILFASRAHEFSNWYESVFEMECDITHTKYKYRWAEQRLQHAKALLFKQTETAASILKATTPDAVNALGLKKFENWSERTWDQERPQILRKALVAKFNSSSRLAKILLDTGSALIAECLPNETVYGSGLSERDARQTPVKQWPGKNLQGETLMWVRDVLREAVNAARASKASTPSDEKLDSGKIGDKASGKAGSKSNDAATLTDDKAKTVLAQSPDVLLSGDSTTPVAKPATKSAAKSATSAAAPAAAKPAVEAIPAAAKPAEAAASVATPAAAAAPAAAKPAAKSAEAAAAAAAAAPAAAAPAAAKPAAKSAEAAAAAPAAATNGAKPPALNTKPEGSPAKVVFDAMSAVYTTLDGESDSDDGN